MKNQTENIRKTFIFLVLVSFTGLISGAAYTLEHVDPPMWWTGMNNQELMITIHGSNVSDLDPVIDYPGHYC